MVGGVRPTFFEVKMRVNREPTDDELIGITLTGFLRSIELLERFVLNNIDMSSLHTEREREFLNRVKERANMQDNPIAVYLRPGAE